MPKDQSDQTFSLLLTRISLIAMCTCDALFAWNSNHPWQIVFPILIAAITLFAIGLQLGGA